MIIVFSGCGNTAAVAAELASHTNDEVVRLTPEMLRADMPAPSLEVSGRHIVWAFPTYSWGVPPVVRRFMRRVNLPGAGAVGHVMVTTCGDDIGRCADMWRRDIVSRGWKPIRAFSVTMPNTYVTMRGFDVDKRDVAVDKLANMPGRVADIAAHIDEDGPDDLVAGRMAWLKTAVVYPSFVRMGMSPVPFCHTDACTGCGSCAERCPMANIAMTGRRPQWGDDCAFCLGCYHVCPAHAVAYGKTTGSKGQYRGPDSFR